MRLTRRTFVQSSAFAGVGLLAAGRRALGQVSAPPKWNLTKFVAPLPGVGPSGISVASPNTTMYPGTDFYRIVLGQYRYSFHPELPASKLWGYADATGRLPRWRYLNPAIVAVKGTPTRISFINLLPPVHPLPVDTTIPGAEVGQLVNRAAIHLHGGFVPWHSDGGPFHWFAPNGTHGPSLMNWLPNPLGLLTDDYWYTNAQTARLMWYHDHAVGITRLNAYAGLAAPYILADADELSMFGPFGNFNVVGNVVPGQVPGIPLVLQDKSFKAVSDAYGHPGDLDYPIFYPDPTAVGPLGTPPVPSAQPEFFSDNIVINGKAFPQLTLPEGIYRFRMLNATQSRVFNLQLYYESAGSGEPNLNVEAPPFVQIGTEGGFLPKPVVVPSNRAMNLQWDAVGGAVVAADYLNHVPGSYGLILAGAERADVLIDFTGKQGSSFILCNDAPAPFPAGEPDNDYFTGAPASIAGGGTTGNPLSGSVGKGPNTRTMMRITITGPGSSQVLDLTPSGPLATKLASIASQPFDVRLGVGGLGLLIPDYLIGTSYSPADLLAPYMGVGGAYNGTIRNKTLNEGTDDFGRLIQVLGTDTQTNELNTVYGQKYLNQVTVADRHQAGKIEVWDVYNTTGDVHPIHFHLVNVQIIGRAPFAQDANTGVVSFVPGAFVPPDDNERGYKETVRMNPGEVTRVVMKFDLPPDPVVRVWGVNKVIKPKKSPRTGGYEYVWHCHILEHEEHDMMRPMVVG